MAFESSSDLPPTHFCSEAPQKRHWNHNHRHASTTQEHDLMELRSVTQSFALREQKDGTKTMTITIDLVVCEAIDRDVAADIEVMGFDVLAKAMVVEIDLLFVNKAMGTSLPVEVKVVAISSLSVAEIVVEVRLRCENTLERLVSVLRRQQDETSQRLRHFPVWAKIGHALDLGRRYQIVGSAHDESRSRPARIVSVATVVESLDTHLLIDTSKGELLGPKAVAKWD